MKDLWWLIIILIAGGVLWFMRGGPQKFETGGMKSYLSPPDISIKMSTSSTTKGGVTNPPRRIRSTPIPTKARPTPTINPNDSLYKGRVFLARGSAGIGDAQKEYIYIRYRTSRNNTDPIIISGWQLKNNGSNRTYNIYGRDVKGQSTYVTIPPAVMTYTGKNDPLVPVVLAPGDSAIVLSGNYPPIIPRLDKSFRVNKCIGYINAVPGHSLVPPANSRCPDYKTEPGLNQLTYECSNFIKSHYGSSCRTPVIKLDNDKGELIDGQVISQSCKNYIYAHFSYDNCLAIHKNDQGFYLPEWRIYLNQIWPLWDKNRETITLLDNYGKIVDQISYGY